MGKINTRERKTCLEKMTKKIVLTASEVLALAENSKDTTKPSTNVNRPLEQENDLGNLLGVEINEFELDETCKEDLLKARARDNCQLLLNEIWQLPTERVEEAIVAVLPPPTSIIPREKPVPKPKPLTKWEQYAKEKGIVNKKKKSSKVWDDVVKDWVPRFGYKKAKAETEKNWLMEYKEGQDQDPREKAIEEKREKVAKNELQRLRNLARAKNTKVPGVGLTPTISTESQSSNDLKKASELAKKSTASLGKFQEKLPKTLENKLQKPKGKKRKFDSVVGKNDEEKAKNMKVFDLISSKGPKIDVSKGVGRLINSEEKSRSADKKSGGKKGSNKKGGKGGKGRAKNFFEGRNGGGGSKFSGKGKGKGKQGGRPGAPGVGGKKSKK